jgi:hypothetical protein
MSGDDVGIRTRAELGLDTYNNPIGTINDPIRIAGTLISGLPSPPLRAASYSPTTGKWTEIENIRIVQRGRACFRSALPALWPQ